MMRALLDRLFEHVFWADGRVVEVLSAGQTRQNDEAIRLFSHVLAAERVWLLRLRGEDSSIQPIWPELALPEIEALAAANRAGYSEYFRTLSDAGLDRTSEYRNSSGATFRTRVADILSHVALHGAYHRGQIARAIRAAGEAPVNTDFITFVREQA
jgi:uncharacterized damage-inducible protein DinB